MSTTTTSLTIRDADASTTTIPGTPENITAFTFGGQVFTKHESSGTFRTGSSGDLLLRKNFFLVWELYQDGDVFQKANTASDYPWDTSYFSPVPDDNPYPLITGVEDFSNPVGGTFPSTVETGVQTYTITREGQLDTAVRPFTANNAPTLHERLSETLVETLENALSGIVTVTDELDLYSSTSPFTRNPNFFLADRIQEFTCISADNSRHNGGATLITPTHALCAEHYALQVGDTISWVTADNTVIQRTVTVATPVVYRENTGGTNTPDYVVLTLNEALPSTITPALVYDDAPYGFTDVPFEELKTFPVSYKNYSKELEDQQNPNAAPLPRVNFNRLGKAGVLVAKSTTQLGAVANGRPSLNDLPQLDAYFNPLNAGDSGHPEFIITPTESMLSGVNLGQASNIDISKYRKLIENVTGRGSLRVPNLRSLVS